MRNSLGKTSVSLLLICTIAIGQEQSAPTTHCGCKKYTVGEPAVAVFQRYDALPRNRDEDVAIVLFVPVNEFGCCALTNNPKQPDIYPTRLELQPSPEFTIQFRSGFRHKSHKPGAPIEMAAGDKIALLKLRANRDTPLGSYVLRGKLTYQEIKDRTLQIPQELDVVIAVKVVADKSKVQEIEWPFGSHFRHDMVRILALPVELPAAALLAIACSNGCDL